MFQKTNKTESATSSINIIGAGTGIIGDVTSSGDMRIDGSLKGNLTITGKLVLGASAKIEGDIACQNADVSGEIKGTVTVSELLSLKASANIIGDITTDKLAIEPNATFTGTCKMGASIKNISNGNQAQQATSKTA